MDMGSLRRGLEMPHHFIHRAADDDELDEDVMILGTTPQVCTGIRNLKFQNWTVRWQFELLPFVCM